MQREEIRLWSYIGYASKDMNVFGHDDISNDLIT